jgi:hypothetical protein
VQLECDSNNVTIQLQVESSTEGVTNDEACEATTEHTGTLQMNGGNATDRTKKFPSREPSIQNH